MAEDVVQDVFSTFWNKGRQMNPDTPLAAYLYRLTRNRILNLISHTKVEQHYLENLKQVVQSTGPSPDQLYIERELFDQIEKEIENLPDKMRRVFEMSRKEFKSNQQIADELNISQQTVKNQISKALRVLRGGLGNKLDLFLFFF